MTTTSRQVVDTPKINTKRADAKRTQLLDAIGKLETSAEPETRRFLALAEAEFRLAILVTTELQEALDRLRKAVTYDPFHPKYFFHMGRLLYRSGEYFGAVAEFLRALNLAPASHRSFVHLALALLELNEKGKKAGQEILNAVTSGDDNRLSKLRSEVDALIKAEIPPADTKDKAPPSTKGNKMEAQSRPAPGQQASRVAVISTPTPPPTPPRLKGIWRLSLAEQLTRAKPNSSQITEHMDVGKELAGEKSGASEYVMACLLLLLNREPTDEIEKRLNDEKLLTNAQHRAVHLVRAALDLKASKTPQPFVERAVKYLRNGTLPLELICWLHYDKCELDGSVSVVEAIRWLDAYPQDVQSHDCFRELRLAILDTYARKAWGSERLEHAKLLWREARSLDPHRIDIAHNLALLAARAQTHDDYAVAWERAAELRYLHAAAAGDIEVLLEDRRILHQSFAQQSKQRYVDSDKFPNQSPKAEELAAWLADKSALDVWLREWDLYYLNSRLRFRSPVHLLGVAKDATQETMDEARDALLHQMQISLRGQPWAGIKAFCELAGQRIQSALEQASDSFQLAGDSHYELEKEEADKLAIETIDRGFLLDRLLMVLVKNPTTSNLSVGCTVARCLLALPWKVLQPICVRRGYQGDDLVEVFESHFLALAAGDGSRSHSEREAQRRASALGECIAVLPHRIELVVWQCQMLLTAKKNHEAYSAALAAFPLVSKIEDQKTADAFEQNLLILMSEAGFAELPEQLSPSKSLSLEEAEATVKEGSKILVSFSCAAQLRKFLINLMIQLSDESHTKSAEELAEEGIRLALNEKQRTQFQDSLEQARTATQKAAVIKEIKGLLEGASKRVNDAIQEANLETTTLQEVRRVMTEAIQDATRAKEIATKAGLEQDAQQAQEFIQQLRDRLASLENR